MTGPRAVPDAETAIPAAAASVVSVDNNWCHLYGICVQEAPEVFAIGDDGRLRYTATPDPALTPAVRQAARLCPAAAITVTTRKAPR